MSCYECCLHYYCASLPSDTPKRASAAVAPDRAPSTLVIMQRRDAATIPGVAATNEATTDDATEECVVCMVRPRVLAIVPCGHVPTCEKCAGGMRECPMCRASISGVLRIYR
jgi:hypothetical protein